MTPKARVSAPSSVPTGIQTSAYGGHGVEADIPCPAIPLCLHPTVSAFAQWHGAACACAMHSTLHWPRYEFAPGQGWEAPVLWVCYLADGGWEQTTNRGRCKWKSRVKRQIKLNLMLSVVATSPRT